ncbi:hypothetical protein WQ57_03170 [Mesobacillus campisalis]|uniref:UPF0637 protein WQ57_03170 n=1 Tax=Mesobacillus campisalis TaxID=1408103 RepID=A0A0M2T4G2_9BACI|nr:DUF1054 domain-containing protein [Mesobacillus campisalis]KKK39705.1 hypothetical protein WQ57_03170 [Mesobacillus campisalis]
MTFSGFTDKDFEVFTIDGLDERMEALKQHIRPKLEELGSHFTPQLSSLVGDEMYYHVAKHARRTKNPPNDTWVAFAANPRGYKMMPHFQIGLWETHLFVWFALIYEAPNKEKFGKLLERNADTIFSQTPEDFVWSTDHTKPDVIPQSGLSKDELLSLFNRLQTVKKAEILCGYQIPRDKAITLSSDELIEKIEVVFKTLLPLYKLA